MPFTSNLPLILILDNLYMGYLLVAGYNNYNTCLYHYKVNVTRIVTTQDLLYFTQKFSFEAVPI
jgi:hypothetical protein